MFDAVYQYLSVFSRAFGTGDTASDLVGVTLVVSFLALMIGLISYRRERSSEGGVPSVERFQAMNGKIEKLERTLNDFRSEMLRHAELSKGSLEFAKEEIVCIRDAVFALLDRSGGRGTLTPSRSGGSSSGPAPGGSAPPSSSDPGGGMSAMANVTSEISAKDVQTFFKEINQAEPPAEASFNVFGRLRKSRENIVARVKNFFGGKASLDQSMINQLEEVLISSDMGVKTSMAIIENLLEQVKRGVPIDEMALYEKLKEYLVSVLASPESTLPTPDDGPCVVMLVGVNGAGKTTTVAKLAHQWHEAGKTVMVAAADTFRAAAVDQLKEWADRINVPIITGAEGAKPATVVFDAMAAAKRDNIDILIIDTAGRLQNKSNLMQELEGIRNVMVKHQPSAPHEVLLVVDGSSGQNALVQAKEFNSAVKLTGTVITKLDGTPKGGIVVAIKSELGIPVRYIGVGEKRDDLKVFDAQEFAEALIGTDAKNLSKLSLGNTVEPNPLSTTRLH